MSLRQLRSRLREALSQPDLSLPYEKATATARAKRARAAAELPDFEEQRDLAAQARRDAIAQMDRQLKLFEERFTRDGGTVHHAADAREAQTIVSTVLREHGARLVVKAKSMLSEEVGLNEHLEREGFDVQETDLGEFIVQIAGQRPSHITAPALHMDRRDIGRLFQEKLGVEYTEDPVELTSIARRLLRQRFLQADAGITGANFLIAETGQIVLLENEANIRLCTTLPKVHIALVGIEKVIGEISELGPLLSLIARSATGQKMGAYTSILGAAGEPPRHVVLVDNGRRLLARHPRKREILTCIRCGACLNACPVYERIGGHAYDSAYSGPIGALLGPHHLGTDHGRELPFASSLCGACSEVCPVKIDIPQLLRLERVRYVETGGAGVGERLGWWFWSKVLTRPRLYRVLGRIGRGILRGPGILDAGSHVLGDWTRDRKLPVPASSSFIEQWKNAGGPTSRTNPIWDKTRAQRALDATRKARKAWAASRGRMGRGRERQ